MSTTMSTFSRRSRLTAWSLQRCGRITRCEPPNDAPERFEECRQNRLSTMKSTISPHNGASEAPAMSAFDLVVRNARVATASDTFDADIGIVGGRIVQLGHGLPARRARDRRRRPRRHAGRRRRALPPRPADGAAGAHGRRLRQRHAQRSLRRHHDGDSVRGAGEGPVAARRGGRLPPPRRRQGACRLRLPPDRQRPDAAGAERGAAGADRARATRRSRST